MNTRLVYFVNVYEDQQGRWHYGWRTTSRYSSERLPHSWMAWIFQRNRRHVCRLRIMYNR